MRLRDANGGIGRPEFRLPLAVAGAVLLPAATCTYGWTAELALPFPFVLITTALIGFSLLLAYLPLVSYVVDAFGLFAASAMTGMIVLRCLMSTFLPLAVSPLVETFGYGWGFTILCVASLLLVPVPLMIMRFGHRWRQLSVFTREETLAQ